MRKEQFEKILNILAESSSAPEIFIVGSQALYGVLDEIPRVAFLSNEVDVLVSDEKTIDIIEKLVGITSEFYFEYGCYAHALDIKANLAFPQDWKTNAIVTTMMMSDIPVKCVFMSPADLCASKLAAGRKKDLEFVNWLLRESIVDSGEICGSIKNLPEKYQQSDAEYMLTKVVSQTISPSSMEI